MNLTGFLMASFRQYWHIGAALLLGALLSAPLSYCQGRHDGSLAMSNSLLRAAKKVQDAALTAERAANAADAVRRAKDASEVQELKDIVHEKSDNSIAGPGVTGVLDRLRQGSGGREDQAAR